MLEGLHRFQGRSLVLIALDDGGARAAAEAYLHLVPPGTATVVTPASLEKARGDCGAVVVFCSDVSQHFQLDMTVIQGCLEKLRPGGCVLARLGGITESQALQLETAGLFAGAVDSQLGDKVPGPAGGIVTVEFSCLKPSWNAGAAASLPGVAHIDEDELLGEVPAPVGKGKSDCSTQPKACANCSCGRKELEEKVGAEEAKKRLEQGKERSACGSCYLGDAFRCETCPYRGLPAFKPGTKVELSGGETEGTGQLDLRLEAEGLESKGGKLVLDVA